MESRRFAGRKVVVDAVVGRRNQMAAEEHIELMEESIRCALGHDIDKMAAAALAIRISRIANPLSTRLLRTCISKLLWEKSDRTSQKVRKCLARLLHFVLLQIAELIDIDPCPYACSFLPALLSI